MKIKKHFGVYGVCILDDKLLCINKTRGPYQNRYDLPGGSQKKEEGLTETLDREVLEETGYHVLKYSNSRAYDIFLQENNENYRIHHIMVFYDIKVSTNKEELIRAYVNNEINDSNGCNWVNITELNEENSSPLILKVKEEYGGESESLLKKITYLNWNVK